MTTKQIIIKGVLMKYIDHKGDECEDVGNCKICNEDTNGDNELCEICWKEELDEFDFEDFEPLAEDPNEFSFDELGNAKL